MASEIIVNTIKAPTTGANANKVIIPTGMKLVATDAQAITAPGMLINQQQFQTSTDIDTSSGAFNTVWTFNYTPVSTNSKIYFTHCLNLRGFQNSGADGRFEYRVLLAGTTYFTTKDAGSYDYGGSGVWMRTQYSETTVYTNSSSSAIEWRLQVSAMVTSSGRGVRFNEASGGTPISTCLVQEIAQ